MEERLKEYIRKMDRITSEKINPEEKDGVMKDLLIQIQFFQHERFVHLIVTVTFAILTLMTLFACLFADNIALYIMLVLFLVLLIPYIRHYYILENGVQKLYTFYDRL
mgnify:FL=1